MKKPGPTKRGAGIERKALNAMPSVRNFSDGARRLLWQPLIPQR